MRTEKEIELDILDHFLEHVFVRMERRKHEIEDENYLYAKCVAIPNHSKRGDRNGR